MLGYQAGGWYAVQPDISGLSGAFWYPRSGAWRWQLNHFRSWHGAAERRLDRTATELL